MPKHIALPPIERLNELLKVVEIPESKYGVWSGLVWKVGRQGTKGIGSVAGSKLPNSRAPGRFDWKVMVDGRLYPASRIVYWMANGVDPDDLQVDHKDRNPFNNNVENLRLADRSVQGHNRGPRSINTSGAMGVHWDKQKGKWRAQLWNERKYFSLGRYTCKIEAARVVNDKIIELGLDKIGKPLIDLESLECSCSSCQNSPA